jgi:hypothetical protein
MSHVLKFTQFNESRRGEEPTSWYYGIAACDGLESFIKEPDLTRSEQIDRLNRMGLTTDTGQIDPIKKEYGGYLNMMQIRCKYNAQRWAVVYRVKLTDSAADIVQSEMDEGNVELALIFLKDMALETQIARGNGMNNQKVWDRIPDRSLDPMSESLKYHINEGLSIAESVYRPASKSHLDLLLEARKRFDSGELLLEGIDKRLFEETDLGRFGEYSGETVPLDFLFEAEYHDKTVELGKPMRGGEKKYHVYVMNPKTKKVKKIAFGDVHGGLTAKVSDPKARKSFAARHQCHLKNDKLTAGYWACRINRYAHLWGGKTYPGFW